MQKPASGRLAIAEQPQPHTGRIAGNVVVALNIAAVPPATLDPLRSLLELEHPFEARLIAVLEQLRLDKQPQGSFGNLIRRFRLRTPTPVPRCRWQRRLRDAPGRFRAMLRNQAKSINGLGSQTVAQALDELRHAGTGLA